jgi:hypothetical protein
MLFLLINGERRGVSRRVKHRSLVLMLGAGFAGGRFSLSILGRCATVDDGGRMANDVQAAKDLICQIIAAAGGRLEGKLRLYKAFYYAHLFYWQRGAGVLTQQPIVRMPLGPGIHEAKSILEALQQEGKIRVSARYNGPYQESVYELTSRFEINPADPRYQAVEQAVEFVRDKTAVELSEETHLYSRSWRMAKDGEILDIYADLLSDDEESQIGRAVTEAETLINAAF